MSVITQTNTRMLTKTDARATQMPFLAQVGMLTRRSLTVMFRDPASVVPGLILGVFFLLVYDASLSGAATFFLAGQSYLGFVLPLSVISSALSGASIAGQTIVRDIESGYFDKLLLTPISRGALLLGPMVAAAVVLVLQTCFIIGAALVMGLQPVTGVLGLLALLGYTLIIGLGFGGLIVGIALRTNSAAATSGASFLFFPFTFLTATFTPVELLSGWIRTAADYNPITYILEATRSILNTGWDMPIMLRGLAIALVMALVGFSFALVSLRGRTRRQ